MTKQLPTPQGIFILVSDEDYERASQHSWPLDSRGYAHATIKQKNVLLHRWLVGAREGEEVDHKNHNTLDCRRENLRRCTKSQNMANMRIPRNNTTGFKGVTYDKRVNRFTARIKVNRHHRHLGSFVTAEEAAVAYNFAALESFGEFAYFNDVPSWRSRTPPQPAKVTELRINNSSGYPGVSFNKRTGKWVAYLSSQGRSIHIGTFQTPEEAVAARAQVYAAKKARGATSR
jgi:hypothetical protein